MLTPGSVIFSVCAVVSCEGSEACTNALAAVDICVIHKDRYLARLRCNFWLAIQINYGNGRAAGLIYKSMMIGRNCLTNYELGHKHTFVLWNTEAPSGGVPIGNDTYPGPVAARVEDESNMIDTNFKHSQLEQKHLGEILVYRGPRKFCAFIACIEKDPGGIAVERLKSSGPRLCALGFRFLDPLRARTCSC